MDQKKVEHKKGISLNPWTTMFLVVALVIGLSMQVVVSGQVYEKLNKRVADAKEAQRPANLSIMTIKDANCMDCFNVLSFAEAVKKYNINLEKESEVDISSSEGKDLVKKYNITKIPSVVVSGEIGKDVHLNEQALKDTLARGGENTSIQTLWKQAGEIIDGGFVLRQTGFPYVDTASGDVKGRVRVTIISNKSCTDCFDAEKYGTLGLPTQFKETFDASSNEGKALIKKYEIATVPTAIVTGDIDSFPLITKYGEIRSGAFVLTKINMPYMEMKTNRVRGKANIIYVTDKTCTECFSVDIYDQAIERYAVYAATKKNVDVASVEGAALVKKYNIKSVPAFIAQGDFGPYNTPDAIWTQLGTTEKDGTYVLREEGMKTVGIYKDITKNQIVKPAE